MARKIQIEILGDARSVGRAFKSAGRDGQRFAATVERNAARVRLAFVALGAAVVGGLIKASRAFSGFEQSMSRIVGLAGGAEKQVAKFRTEILKIAPRLGVGPRELGESLYFVASAGIKASEQMGVVKQSAMAAVAGLGETATVADAVTSAMNAYGSSTLNAKKATDVLVATVREGKGEASSFAPVIGNVAALAAKLGVSFNDVGAALAAQTRLGTDAETASTQLQALFSGLLKTAPKAEKEMKKYGLSSAGLRKELREKGLLSVLQKISLAFGDNDEAMARSFPNIRALRGLLSLVGANAKETTALFKRMADTTGATAHAFDVASKDEAFKWNQAKAAVEGAFIRIGGLAAPAVSKLAQGLSAGVTHFNDFLDELDKPHTIGGKIKVVWKNVKGTATSVARNLRSAIDRIDWGQVWGGVAGIGDEIQKNLERVDWKAAGRSIGNGIRTAVLAGVETVKELGAKIRDAVHAINWADIGKEMGPGLASAITVAFLTLLDPTFWIKNWDLALAVAFVAAGGALESGALKLAAPLLKVGARIVGDIGKGMIRSAPALAREFENLMVQSAKGLKILKRIFDATIGSLAHRIEQFLEKHGILRFAVKVTGVLVIINAIEDMLAKVKGKFHDFTDWLTREALHGALQFVEPFSHIPGKGGKWARDLKDKWHGQLAQMQIDAFNATHAINENLSKIEDAHASIFITTVYSTKGHPDEGTRGRPPRTPANLAADRAAQSAGGAPGAAAPGKKDPLAGERARIAAQRAQLDADKKRFAAEQGAAAKAKQDAKDAKKHAAQLRKEAREAAAERKRELRLRVTAEKAAAKVVKDAADKAREAWQKAREVAKESFGQMFQGPLLGGPLSGLVDAINQAGTGKLDPTIVLQDILGQNKRTNELLQNLHEIEKRGAPKSLIAEIRALGPSGAPIAESIANAPQAVFNKIAQAARQREADIKAETVVIHADTVVLPKLLADRLKQVAGSSPSSTGRSLVDDRRRMIQRAAGGTVPGAGHGDKVPAMLTPGELVLNRRQQHGVAGALGMKGATPDKLFAAISGMAAGGVAKKREYTPQEQLLRMLYMEGSFPEGTWVDRVNRWFPKAMGKIDSAAAWMTLAKPSDIAHAIKDPKWGYDTYTAYRRKASEQLAAVRAAEKQALKSGDRKAFERLQSMELNMTQAAVTAGPLKGLKTTIGSAFLKDAAASSARLLKKGEGATLLADLSPDSAHQYVAAYAAYSRSFPANAQLGDALLQFREQHAQMLLKDPALRIGAYRNPAGGLELEISRVFKSRANAKKFAAGMKQWSVWDSKNFTELRTGTAKDYGEALQQQANLVKRGGGGWFPEMATAERLGTNGDGLVKLLAKSGARRKMLYEFLTAKQQMAARQSIVQDITRQEMAKGYPPTKMNRELADPSLLNELKGIPGRPKNLDKPGAVDALYKRFQGMLGLGEANAPHAEKWYKQTGLEARDFAGRAAQLLDAPFTIKQAVDLLAVTSLKARPFDNYMNAVKALKQWKAGKPVHVSTKQVDSNIVDVLSGKDPWGSDALKRPAYRDNILKYADPKGYAKMGKGNRLTVDRHVAATAFGKDVPSDIEYEWMRGFFNILQKRTGKSVENLQAIGWVPQKAMNLYASRLLRFGPDAASVKGKTWRDYIDEALDTYANASSKVEGFMHGGKVPGHGSRDTVPAMLTPGEVVLNRGQQKGLARVLGISGATPDKLFRSVSQFRSGGVVGGRPDSTAMLSGRTPSSSAGTVVHQHNTIEIPATFRDTQWAVDRAMRAASWRLKNGV